MKGRTRRRSWHPFSDRLGQIPRKRASIEGSGRNPRDTIERTEGDRHWGAKSGHDRNRRVRNRMHGGVGGGRREASSYPIRVRVDVSFF
jgi:hypothetical protein